jgi:aminoglycoside phosphotransferase (APT) family kinase protein
VNIFDESAELIRIGSNAVFRVSSEVIARIAPGASSLDNAALQIRVSQWLMSVPYPVVRALDVAQPIEADGAVVTLWESVSAETRYADIADVAALIKRLHGLAAPDSLRLPDLSPFAPAAEVFPRLGGLSADDRAFLCERIEWARLELPRLPFALPAGVIHGDANVGNVLSDEDGQPVLIDLDSFAVGHASGT